MDSFVILGFLLAVFLQFIPPQLCEVIRDYEVLERDEDGFVDTIKIGRSFSARARLLTGEEDADYEYIPETCYDHFCEKVPFYPLDKIENAIKDIPSTAFHGLQGNVIKIAFKPNNENGTSLCDSKQRLIFPQKATNIVGKEVFIVNHPGKQQGVIVTTCSPDIKGCGSTLTFPSGYGATCTQTYSQINLLVYDTEMSTYGINSFSVPSCCMCVLKPPNSNLF